MDYPGKVIRKTPVTPTQASASGVWTVDDALQAVKTNTWPIAGVPNPISRSLRFNQPDSTYLNRTPGSAGNRKTWTWSAWIKLSTLGTIRHMFFGSSGDLTPGTDYGTTIRFDGSNNLEIFDYTNGGFNFDLVTTQVFRDPSSWYHIVVAFDTTQATSTNRVKLYINGSQVTAFSTATYPTQNTDYWINSTNLQAIGDLTANGGGGSTTQYFSGYMAEINFVDGQALTPSSFGMTDPQTGAWEPIKYTGTYGTNGFYLNFSDNSSTSALGNDYSGNGNNWTTNNFSVGTISSKVLEIVDATKSGSVTLSATVVGSGTVNLTAFGGCGNISGSVFTGISGYNGLISDWQTHTVYKNGSSLFTVQGGAVNNNSGTQTATQSRTAQTVTQTGISVVSGDVISITFGANNAVTPYYGYPNGAPSLTISASSGAFIADGSNNDSLTDVPTPWIAYNTTGDVGGVVRGNYATWNAVSGYAVTLTNGNLDYTTGTSSNPVTSTWSLPTSGKWYWEVTVSSVGEAMIGIQTRNNLAYAGPKTAYYRQGGASNSIFIEGSANVYNASSYTNGDVIGVAYNADSSQISWYKNNTQQGGPYTLTSLENLTPIIIQASLSGSNSGSVNFGQRPFAYTPPAGFRSLCTTNLPTPTIGATSTTQADDYMNIVLYTGNGGTPRNITGVNFQPDFVWLKSRNSASFSHRLYDAVRGVGKELYSNATAAESDVPQSLTAFISDGFSLGTDTNNNATSTTYVAWNWKANGSGSTNTAGSITSTVSVNATAGFSIVTYTGNNSTATIGHGLGVAPSMIIIKDRLQGTGYNWNVYHASIGNTQRLFLDATSAATTGVWNNTSPTSTVFTVINNAAVNGTDNYVAYCWTPIAGYSAFGSYTGNGSTDGPFVYTGFRPRYVMFKRTNSTGNWIIEDTSRSPYNQMDAYISANASSAEATGAYYVDYLSNGFKLRYADPYGDTNASGSTYIYAAFAEFPFKFANAR